MAKIIPREESGLLLAGLQDSPGGYCQDYIGLQVSAHAGPCCNIYSDSTGPWMGSGGAGVH